MRPETLESALNNFQQTLAEPFQLKAVFFDMDGVLFDSMPLHAKSWIQTFNENGVKLKPEEPFLHEGSPAFVTSKNIYKQYTKQVLSDEMAAQFKARKHSIMGEFNSAPIMQGMPEFVSALDKNEIDCWVVTGSAQSILLNRLSAEFNGIIQAHKMITAHDVKVGKPTPEPYLKAMEKSGYAAHEAVVIENAPLGILSAKAAGLFTIAINSGPLNANLLWNAGADIVFDSSTHLLSQLPAFCTTFLNTKCPAT